MRDDLDARYDYLGYPTDSHAYGSGFEDFRWGSLEEFLEDDRIDEKSFFRMPIPTTKKKEIKPMRETPANNHRTEEKEIWEYFPNLRIYSGVYKKRTRQKTAPNGERNERINRKADLLQRDATVENGAKCRRGRIARIDRLS